MMLNAPMDDAHPTVSPTLLPMYNPEFGCVAGYMRKMPSKLTSGYWTRMNKWPQRWFWVSLDLHGQQNYQLCYTKQGAHTSHTVQRVYHLVNGKLERISDTSFVLHIPNGEDVCLQCDSLMETNRWWSTLSQLIHAANIRAESLSSAYIANLPSFDSIRTGRSHSWAHDSGASSFEDTIDTSSDKKNVSIFVKGNGQNDVRDSIPLEADDEDISEESSDHVDYDSKTKSSLNYEAMDEPGEGLRRTIGVHDLSLSSNDVPLVPNTHDRDFFNQLQHVLPREGSALKAEQDDITNNTNNHEVQEKEISTGFPLMVNDIAETVSPVLNKVDTMMQAVSSMLNNAVQETLTEVANEDFPSKPISPMTSYKDRKNETICEENVSPTTHTLPNSEITGFKPLTDEEKLQQQLPIVSPSVIYGGHFASDDNVDNTDIHLDSENNDIPVSLIDASSSISSTTANTCFEGLTADTSAMQEIDNDNIKINIENKNIQSDPTKEVSEQVFEGVCMLVGEDEQDVACGNNSLVFKGAIRHIQQQPNGSLVAININPIDTSTVSDVHLISSLLSDKEIQKFADDNIAIVDTTVPEIPASPPATPFDAVLNLKDSTQGIERGDSIEDMASSECSTESVQGSPPKFVGREILLDPLRDSFSKNNVPETDHDDNSAQLRESSWGQNDTRHQDVSQDNDYHSVTYETVNEIDDILTKYCAVFLWMGSHLLFLKPITPILKTIWEILSFSVVGLFTFMVRISWLVDVFVFQSWCMIQCQWVYIWEKWYTGGEVHATRNKDLCESIPNIDEKKTFGELTDFARNISMKEADLSLQSSCL